MRNVKGNILSCPSCGRAAFRLYLGEGQWCAVCNSCESKYLLTPMGAELFEVAAIAPEPS